MIHQQTLFDDDVGSSALPPGTMRKKRGSYRRTPSIAKRQQQLDLNTPEIHHSDPTPLPTVTIEEIDDLLALFTTRKPPTDNTEWSEEDIDAAKRLVLFRSLQILLYLKTSNNTRDELWNWIFADEVNEPFGFINCALNIQLNPAILREDIQNDVNCQYRQLAKQPSRTATQQSFFNWLSSRVTPESPVRLNSVEDAVYRLSFNFPVL